jgi:hypothetical protein
MPNANIPIDRYNSQGFRYKPMNQFHWPFGEIYDASIRLDRAMFDINLNTRRQRATAKSTSSTGIDQRDVRFVMQGISVGAGYALVGEEKFVMYIGTSLDAGFMRLQNRTGPANQISRVPYQTYRRSPMLASSIWLKMVFRANPESISVWSLSPYVHLPLQKFDFLYLDQVLMNTPPLPALPGPLYARPVNFGLSLNIDIDLLGFLEN